MSYLGGRHLFQVPLKDRGQRDPEGAEAREQHALEGVAVSQLDESPISCVVPPKISPTLATTGVTPAEIAFTLTRLSMSVTTANANSESGPALPQPEGVTR